MKKDYVHLQTKEILVKVEEYEELQIQAYNCDNFYIN